VNIKRLILLLLFLVQTRLCLAQSAFISHHGSVQTDQYYNIVQFKNGNFIAVGQGGCRLIGDGSSTITLFDSLGKILKEWTCEPNTNSNFNDIIKLNDNECIIGGTNAETSSEGNQHLLKMNSNGEIIKDTFYSQDPGSGAFLSYMTLDKFTKNIYTIGMGVMPGFKLCMSIQKIDSNFKQVWFEYLCGSSMGEVPKAIYYDPKHDELVVFTKTLEMFRVDAKTGQELTRINLFDLKYHDGGISFYSDSYILKSIQLEDSNYMVCYSYNKRYKYNFVVYDRFGKIQKEYTLNAIREDQNNPMEIASIHMEKNVYLFYMRDENMTYLYKTDSNFTTLFLTPWDTSVHCTFNNMHLKPDGSVFGCGAYCNDYDTRYEDYFIFKTDQYGKVSNSNQNTANQKNTSYPNPADRIHILNLSTSNNEIRIYDSLGKQVLLQQDKTINTENFENGTYFILIKDIETNKFSSQKLVVLHR